VEEPTTSSDNEGSTERPAKKPRAASSASVMHVQPLRSDDDEDHNLLLSTLTGGHGVFMAEAELSTLTCRQGVYIAEAEVDEVEDWYDPDNDWYDSDNNLQIPLFDAHGAHGICFQNLTGGHGAIFSDCFDQAVWAYFKPAGDETIVTITSTIAELQKFGPGFMMWNPQDRAFAAYLGDAGMQAFQAQQGELPAQAQREIFQLADSGATIRIVPDYIANAMMAPVPPPEPYVPVFDLDDFLSHDDDDELLELPPGGPAAWVAPAAPRPPVVELDLDAFLLALTSLFSSSRRNQLNRLVDPKSRLEAANDERCSKGHTGIVHPTMNDAPKAIRASIFSAADA
jgi:hypothetical protein